jgi:hypothetical protein
MATNYNPKLVTNGIVLCLDAANQKSYPGTGTAWTDISNNSNSGNILGGVTYQSSNKGIFSFDGVDDRVNCGNNSSINFGEGDFTLSIWFRRFNSATTNLRLLSKGAGGDTADQAGFAIFGSNTSCTFIINPSGTRVSVSLSYSINEWVNATCILERGVNMRVYKNSVLINTNTAPVGSVTGASSLSIGDNQDVNLRWYGDIASLYLYNRALTNNEIIQNFNALRGRYGI